ncbi:MAG: hypothetical protein ABSG81_14455 [Acidimicrobiales bacterium]
MPLAVHDHALAAQQRFVSALLAGSFTFVFGVALSVLRSGRQGARNVEG